MRISVSRRLVRNLLKTSTAIVPLIASPAFAQDQAQPQPAAAASSDAPAPVSEIVVTGAREAQRAAIKEKSKSLVIRDSVTQDDIGRLPDTTVVEAARRIPGVSVNLLTDNNRGRSEVQRASIRGFDAKYNLVTIDGSEIALIDTTALSTGGITRAFNLNLLPASLVNRIDVIKSVTAEYDAQALGGQIDLVTRSAFSTPHPFYVNVSAFGGVDTSSGDSVSGRKPSQRYSAVISDRADLGNSRIGFTLAADYQDTWGASNGISVGQPGASNQDSVGWTYYGANGRSVAGPAQAAGSAVPTRDQVYSFDDHLRHYSVSGKLEFESGSNFKSSLFAGYYGSQSIETRNENLVTRVPTSQITGTGAPGTGAPANQTATTGFISMNDVELGFTYQPIYSHTDIVNWKNEYDLTDRLKLRLDAAWSQADGHLYRNMVKYVAAPTVSTSGTVSPVSTPNIGLNYDTSGFVPIINFTNPSYVTNPANYGGNYWRYINFRERDTVFDVHPTLSWNADPDDHGVGFRVGARYTQNKIDYTENYVEYDPKVPSQFLLSAVAGTKNIPIPSWGIPVGLLNQAAANAVLNANISAFTPQNETTNDNQNGFGFRERTAAGFVQAVVNLDAFKAQAGLRYDSTTNDINNLQQTSNGVYTPVNGSSNYHAWLPSVVASYSFNDNLIAHAAITKTIGRPDPSAYGPLAKVGQPSSAGQISVTLGNPDIKPRSTWNYDAALDFYFDHHNSLISLQYFHKDLKNEFYNAVFSAPYVYNGTTYLGNFTQVTNGAKATVNGIEANFQIDKLPIIPENLGSFGFGANFTKIWTDLSVLGTTGAARTIHGLINQPTYIANASLFYNYKKFQLALSFNAQGKTLFQTGGVAWMDDYVLARHQIDLTARYQVTPRVTLLFEGANLTSEPFRSAVGPSQNLVADYYNIGAQLWAGVNFKF